MGPIVIIVGVLLMVIIHEGGHFVAAKFFNMKATEAFFGFGPTLWSMRRGETEYGVKAIPLGGYVRIVGMNPFEEVAPEEEHRTYRQKPFWQKSIVVLAGIASHFVVAFFLFYAVAVAYNAVQPSTKVAFVSDVLVTDGGANNPIPLTLQPDDQVISVGGVPLAELSPLASKDPGAVIDVVVERDGKMVTLETTDNVVPTPAHLLGIQPGDRLVSVDGIPVESWDDFVALAHDRPGQQAVVAIERDGNVIDFNTTFAARPRAGGVEGFFGVSPEGIEENIGPIAGIGAAGGLIAETSKLSVEGLFEMVRSVPRLFSAAVGRNTAELADARPVSVIGLVRVAQGLEFSLFLLAYVNVFVGILNMIPLYPLDGGHFAVALYEKIVGRRADVRKLMPVAAAVFIFIVVIGVLGIYFDIVDPLPIPG